MPERKKPGFCTSPLLTATVIFLNPKTTVAVGQPSAQQRVRADQKKKKKKETRKFIFLLLLLFFLSSELAACCDSPQAVVTPTLHQPLAAVETSVEATQTPALASSPPPSPILEHARLAPDIQFRLGNHDFSFSADLLQTYTLETLYEELGVAPDVNDEESDSEEQTAPKERKNIFPDIETFLFYILYQQEGANRYYFVTASCYCGSFTLISFPLESSKTS